MTWVEACQDKSLQNLPYKIELNRQGKLIMSPTRYKHGYYQSEIAILLKRLLPHGKVVVECAIDTTEGTFVADTTWASPERFAVVQDEFSCSIAPEICAEVWSSSNTTEEIEMKCRLYLDKGALEFWYCDEKGKMTFFDRSGQISCSKLSPEFPTRIPD